MIVIAFIRLKSLISNETDFRSLFLNHPRLHSRRHRSRRGHCLNNFEQIKATHIQINLEH